MHDAIGVATRVICDVYFYHLYFQICTAAGVFELQILKVQNIAGKLMDGDCCDGQRNQYGQCDKDQCDTYFKICLKEYQSTPSRVDPTTCTFGSRTSEILGRNSFQLTRIDSDSAGRIKIPFQFAWMVSFVNCAFNVSVVYCCTFGICV